MGRTRTDIGLRELIGFLSASTALTALAIDTMLPAFSDMRQAFDFAPGSSRVALVVTAFLLGMASGQMLFGPLSDRFGRKPALTLGFMIYILGALGSTFAPTFGVLLVSRGVWGIGSAGPRVVTLAILRDRFRGDQMARVMVFVQAFFLIVPILAPLWGQLWLSLGTWRWTFGQAVVLATLVSLWSLRLPETLAVENRRSLHLSELARSLREILRTRQTVGMALAQTLMLGSFFPWLGSSELIVSEIYGRGSIYILVFAGSGLAMAAATLLSARVVRAQGSRTMVRRFVLIFVSATLVASIVSWATNGVPPFGLFLILVALAISLETAMTPSTASLALEPMGHIAGIASSVVGTLNFAVGAILGYLIDRQIQGTVTPLFVGMLIYGLMATACVYWATGGPTQRLGASRARP